MDGYEELTDYLETMLNLQCENQESLKVLEKDSEQLLEKVREIHARVNGLQMEVEDVLHPPASFPEKKDAETPPAPDHSHLLRHIGGAALLSPLIWNGIAAGVRALQGRAWDLGASGTPAMTALISVAWGLLLIVLEPPLNLALQKREERRLAEVLPEDEELEAFLNSDHPHNSNPANQL